MERGSFSILYKGLNGLNVCPLPSIFATYPLSGPSEEEALICMRLLEYPSKSQHPHYPNAENRRALNHLLICFTSFLFSSIYLF